jgi:L-ascorbate metabolism protein UlaG (beta-lactamase superfamily)
MVAGQPSEASPLVDITWLGHSCFRLRSDQLALITDPYPDSLGISMGQPSAQAVTVSNYHPNHSYWQGISDNIKVFDGPGEYELLGILIRGVMTPPGVASPATSRNTAYHIEMEGIRLGHLGDIAGNLSARQIEDLTPLDVLFVPVGEHCTVSLPRALEITHALNPKLVIPMHFAQPGLQTELNGVESFLKGMEVTEAVPQSRLNVTASTIPQETRVVLLEAQGLPF